MFSQKELMETQWDLIMANFKDHKTASLVRENIEDISSGSSPYRADALRLGFKKAFELKKKKSRAPVPPEVLLRCSNSDCQWHNVQMQRSAMRSDHLCHLCVAYRRPGAHYYQCTGCGFDRTGNYESCQGCGAKFVF